MYAYIAGPLFNQGERWFDEQIEACAVRAGFETFLPHRDNKEAQQDERSLDAIFRGDLRGLDKATVVIANLNGSAIDDGTAWEIGYAFAKGKHLVGGTYRYARDDARPGGQPDDRVLVAPAGALTRRTGGLPASVCQRQW